MRAICEGLLTQQAYLYNTQTQHTPKQSSICWCVLIWSGMELHARRVRAHLNPPADDQDDNDDGGNMGCECRLPVAGPPHLVRLQFIYLCSTHRRVVVHSTLCPLRDAVGWGELFYARMQQHISVYTVRVVYVLYGSFQLRPMDKYI